MTTFTFSEDKDNRFKGVAATHWTHENMNYCWYARGDFLTTEVEAAIKSFANTYKNYDGEYESYTSGSEIFRDRKVNVKVWGLVKEGNMYYWNGEIKTVTFNLGVTVS